MIQEDYVSFETAKLLKENGFDAECHSHYYPCHYPDGSIKYEKDEGAQKGDKTWYNVHSLKNLPKDHYLAPTLQMAMKWLRETHKLFVFISPWLMLESDIQYYFEIREIKTSDFETLYDYTSKELNSFEKAAEAAIKYCLENLI